jgi:hypothetical protein
VTTDIHNVHMPLEQKPGPFAGVNPDLVKESNPKDAIGVTKVPRSTIPAPVIAELGVAMLEGALKYGRHNYRSIGVRASVYYDAAGRHLDSFWEGEDIDPDSGLSHITKAIATLVVLRDAMIRGKMVDDRPVGTKGFLTKLNEKVRALLAQYPHPKAAFLADREADEYRA